MRKRKKLSAVDREVQRRLMAEVDSGLQDLIRDGLVQVHPDDVDKAPHNQRYMLTEKGEAARTVRMSDLLDDQRRAMA